MKQHGISMNELPQSRLRIQEFNQTKQQAIGMLRVDLTIENLKSSVLSDVINLRQNTIY